MRIALFGLLLVSCAGPKPTTQPIGEVTAPTSKAPIACTAPMTVRFYDVGQGLAALVELPDGRHVLVDTGDNPKRSKSQCHDACEGWHQRLVDGLRRDLSGRPIDLLWITHQHSDHLGGAIDVLSTFEVKHYADNGQEADKHEVAKVHETATARGTKLHVVDPEHRDVPLASTDSVKLTAVVPKQWPYSNCGSPHVNDCSIGLRIDVCQSSVLFVGDAEEREEALLNPGPVTLLQVGHHGSETSSTKAFLDRVKPKYAVISAAKRDEGTNDSYCHPRASTIDHLTKLLGGPGQKRALAFDSDGGKVKC
ncbi:MAG: ComEC/Rec2 family competence protein, partial [Polyangiales bacterium]